MYDETVAQMTEEEYDAIIAEAEVYNEESYILRSPLMLLDPDRLEDYWDIGVNGTL